MDPVIYDPDKVIINVHKGAKYLVRICPNATVFDLKMEIKSLLDYSMDRQDLYYNEQHLEDEKKLQNYQILHKAEIKLVLKNNVWVKRGDTNYRLIVTDRMTVGELKEMLQVQFGLPIGMELRLTNQPNRRLFDDSFLQTVGITDGTQLIMS